jgi:hypothetical protein
VERVIVGVVKVVEGLVYLAIMRGLGGWKDEWELNGEESINEHSSLRRLDRWL